MEAFNKAGVTRPHVTVHSMASADGRTDHFAGDVGLYYELAARIPQDAVLAGSGTMVAAAEADSIPLDGEDPTSETSGTAGVLGTADPRPLLVVVDRSGRLTRFAWLRAMPYWRDIVVLCSESTPASHRELLDRHRVGYVVAGADRVDLETALTVLARDHGVRHVRVDSGGTLNGVLLRAGLVDEISVLLCPYAVGGRSARGLFVADDLPADAVDEVTRLALLTVEQLRDGVVHLRYQVTRADTGVA